MTVEFRVLGAIEASQDNEPIPLGYAQLRGMLAVLLVEANHPVSTDQLIERVWADRRLPHQPRRAVQHNITLLRHALEPATDVALTRRGAGYQLTVDPEAVDLHRFRALLAQARAATDDEPTAALLAQALELWRGEPFADVDTAWLHAQRTTLITAHETARLDLTDIRLRQGRHAALLPELADETTRRSLDERLAGQYLLALYRSGRQAQALAHYDQLRHRLAEELGADPSPPLRLLHQQILAADPALAVPAHPTPAQPSAQPTPRQLPAPPRLFTGRVTELAELDKALDEQAEPAGEGGTVVISAIGGAGGIGKTALALHWAHRHQDRFPDGQLYVDLRGFDPSGHPALPGEALRGFLHALGVDPATLPAELDAQAARYRSLLADRRMLILLDNAHDADQVNPLLPGSPTCTVLVTSRRHLAGLAAQHGAALVGVDVLPEPDARDLLAGLVGHDRLAAEPAAVAELLAVCGGVPLAVRIVAARAEHHASFPLAVLAEELRDASGRLDGFDAGDLRVNLRAVLSWSVRTLSPPAATLFALLGNAPGPDIGLPAAAALADLPTGQARGALRELDNASLVQQPVPGRYRMHDLTRLYAADLANHTIAADQREAALSRVLADYTHTAHAADRLLAPHRPAIPFDPPPPAASARPIPDVADALAWFDTEYPALLAAQRVAAEHAEHRIAWQLAWALNTFHHRRGHRHDRLTVWRIALDSAAHLPDPAAGVIAHRLLGRAHVTLAHHDEGIGQLELALALAEQHHDLGQQATTHQVLAWAWEYRGDDRRARDHAVRTLELFRALDQPAGEADALNAVGWYEARLGEYDAARAHCQAALTLFRRHHNPDGESVTLDSLGYLEHHSGNHRDAIGHFRDALALYRDIGNTSDTAITLEALGDPHIALGEREQAREVWQKALELYREQGRETEADRVHTRLADLGPR